eukprot:2288723-Ditylum_brightwellii.AAC.1
MDCVEQVASGVQSVGLCTLRQEQKIVNIDIHIAEELLPLLWCEGTEGHTDAVFQHRKRAARWSRGWGVALGAACQVLLVMSATVSVVQQNHVALSMYPIGTE